jgi:hypothetical protein
VRLAAGVGRRRVAAQERERDRAVNLGEDLRGAGPEALQLRAQLVGQREPMADEVFARAGERAHRLGGIAVGDQHPVTVAVGARELGEHERIEAVALAARRAEARSHRGELVGMHRDHPQAGVQQPLDQQPVRTLDRDQRHVERDQPRAQRRDPALVMPVTATLEDPPVAVDHTDRMLLAGPIDPSEATLLHDVSLHPMTLTAAGGEVPWRSLIDGALTAQLPVAAQGTSTDRREALVSCWPSARASAVGALPAAAGTTEDDQ